MDELQIADEAINLLDQTLRDVRGHISQGPYKGDLFRIFANAYNTDLDLTADRLTRIMIERWPERAFDEKARQEALERLHSYWSEWTYAWDNAYRKKIRSP